ncbi:MAG: bifunctional UDP-N-acetylglucosamine diphosphorylase/glucosamine-1-phosphate N-acetyltransferase GlmU [Gloeomargaritaceae cyanobacterium C42_A2020_066]|nr:bifunctional UDP-N-acetylglucosamine diphosphorylase/glucosamine-1-phosphate N-acetyltransferase GlmU [Gloeomargaritaceae cyanobacterium C42_A2020_066]
MVAVAILAAGKGSRMKSDLPKVLHPLGGMTLIERVLNTLGGLSPERTLIIVGHGAERVTSTLAGRPGLEFVHQAPLLGTGHAVQQLMPRLEGYRGDLLVLNGDVPLLRPATLHALVTQHQQAGNAVTLLTACLADATGYGRVFCDAHNRVEGIIEHRDCTPEQRHNPRVNAGIYCFHWPRLAEVLPRLQSQNQQQEYYLTDVMQWLRPAAAVDVADSAEILGINDRKQLADAAEVVQSRVREGWLTAGVTLIDPASITIDETVHLEPDIVIEPQTHLRGQTQIQRGSHIGPGCWIEDSHIGPDCRVLYAVVSQSRLARGSRVGPYAHLREGVEVGDNCRVGNFVELKKTSLGSHTNVAHLSYLGDASLGSQVNVGGGTITANYDGHQKHPTRIGDRSKTGVNNTLVAPLTVGCDVTIAAGSTITEDLPDDCLAIARSRQVIKSGWRPRYLAADGASVNTVPTQPSL